MPGIDSYTKLMLHFNGGDESSTFTDSSLSPHTVDIYYGSPRIDTAQSVFGGASGRFSDGGLTIADSADWYWGTSDFTIDFRIWFTSWPAVLARICGQGSSPRWWLYYDQSSKKFIYETQGVSGSGTVSSDALSLSLNTWYFVMLVRSGGTTYFRVDSDAKGSGASVTQPDVGNELRIGSTEGGGYELVGFLDELRISKGIARDTSVPTAEYNTGIEYSGEIAESLIVDDNTWGQNYTGYTAEELAIGEDMSAPSPWNLDTSEDVSLAEDIVGLDFKGILLEEAGLDDEIKGLGDVKVDTSEALTIDDAVTRGVEFLAKSISEDLSLQEAITVTRERHVSISEELTLSDTTIWKEYDAAIDVSLPAFTGSLSGHNVLSGEMGAFTAEITMQVGDALEMDADLPAFTAALTAYVNPLIDIAAKLPAFTAALTESTSGILSLDADLPAFTAVITGVLGSNGEIDADLPAFTATITGYQSVSGAIASSLPAFTATLEMDSLTFLVLALNTVNNGLTSYTNYPFNSFAYFNGKQLGCSADGIYEIGAAKDESTNITVTIQTAAFDTALLDKKRIRHAWLGYLSDGALTLSLIINDGTTYDYAVTNYSVYDNGQRVKFGRNIRSRYVSLKLVNVAGASLELDKIRIFTEDYPSKAR